MAILKPLHELSLAEINEELESAGIAKQYKRIDHARPALRKAVLEGKALFAGDGEFVNEEALEAVLASEKAAADAAKAEKAPKEPKATAVKTVTFPEELANHELVGKTVFCRFGRQVVEAIGHVEGEPEKLKAKLVNGKTVAVSACRVSAVRSEYRSRYPVDKAHKTASGKPSIGVEDQITDLLKGATVETIRTVCSENDLDYARWEGLNPGMQRMCLGNRLRGMAQKGKRVVINGNVVAAGAVDEEVAKAGSRSPDDFESETTTEATETGLDAAAISAAGAASDASATASVG